MLKNYLKTALRNLLRNKLYSIINIVGLAVGMATCLLIMLWVTDELRFDRFNRFADRTYRLCTDLTKGGTPHTAPRGSDPMATAIKAQVPEIEALTRIQSLDRSVVSYENKRFTESNILFADPEFFDVLSMTLSSGDSRTALARANTVVITRETATKYFGSEDPVGKVLLFDAQSQVEITGVIETVPSNSHFTFNLLCSYETLLKDPAAPEPAWGRFDTYVYFRLPADADVAIVNGKIASIVDRNLGDFLRPRNTFLTVSLQPLTDIHLHSDFTGGDIGTQGSIGYVWLFGALAIGVLLIACVNFVNLATAGSVRRLREIGVRKTFGATHTSLRSQFLMESVLLAAVALVAALMLMELAAPIFSTIVGRELRTDSFSGPWLIGGLILFAIGVGVLAGIYPALWLSRAKPIDVMKTAKIGGESRRSLRRLLVIGQYALSTGLIIGTITIYRQVNYMMCQPLGFDQEQTVFLSNLDKLPAGAATVLKQEVATVPGVLKTSLTGMVPGENSYSASAFLPEQKGKETQVMLVMFADEDAQAAMGLEVISGRYFSQDNRGDSLGSMIINETAARKLGWTDAVGKTISQTYQTAEGYAWRPKTVIGVVKDFHIEGLQSAITPTCIVMEESPDYPSFSYLATRIASGDVASTLAKIKHKWEQLSSDLPFDYFFANDRFSQQYESERRLGQLALWASILATFVASLGSFGMATYAAQRRTKEVGIRKTLGATTSSVLGLLARDFTRPIIVANIIACPLAYYIMYRWLEGFACRTSVSVMDCALSGLAVFAVALIAVSYKSLRAASANPVDSLKYE